MFCIQPLDQIMQYFGATTAIYFAWLGFYTQMLFFPAIFGLLIFLWNSMGFGGLDWRSNSAPTSRQYCEDERILCPRCDGPPHQCKFEVFLRKKGILLKLLIQVIKDSCQYAKFTALFDNGWTIVFAIIMAVWAQIFCTLWVRRQKTLREKWNLEDETGDAVRLEYENRVKEMKENPNFIDRFLQGINPIEVFLISMIYE